MSRNLINPLKIDPINEIVKRSSFDDDMPPEFVMVSIYNYYKNVCEKKEKAKEIFSINGSLLFTEEIGMTINITFPKRKKKIYNK